MAQPGAEHSICAQLAAAADSAAKLAPAGGLALPMQRNCVRLVYPSAKTLRSPSVSPAFHCVCLVLLHCLSLPFTLSFSTAFVAKIMAFLALPRRPRTASAGPLAAAAARAARKRRRGRRRRRQWRVLHIPCHACGPPPHTAVVITSHRRSIRRWVGFVQLPAPDELAGGCSNGGRHQGVAHPSSSSSSSSSYATSASSASTAHLLPVLSLLPACTAALAT